MPKTPCLSTEVKTLGTSLTLTTSQARLPLTALRGSLSCLWTTLQLCLVIKASQPNMLSFMNALGNAKADSLCSSRRVAREVESDSVKKRFQDAGSRKEREGCPELARAGTPSLNDHWWLEAICAK